MNEAELVERLRALADEVEPTTAFYLEEAAVRIEELLLQRQRMAKEEAT
jgi:predicted DNA-binding protein